MDLITKSSYYEEIKLDNGLVVLVREMPGFSSVHAVCVFRFGSIDREFMLNGTKFSLPAGTAHFLEHKMFENEDGDAFEKYAKTGASANAYTSFEKTAYLFTASQKIDENLDILLNLVSKPYFTAKTIEKEQGIIGQEISMYDDAPEWRLMFALLTAMYEIHPVRDDIAGSADTIAQITPELLYSATNAFYRSDNMILSVAGNITKQQVLDAVERAKFKKADGEISRIDIKEKPEIKTEFTQKSMSVSRPMLGLGFKETPVCEDLCGQEMLSRILCELIIGDTTPLYRKLYDDGLIDGGFNAEFLILDGAYCFMFSGETQDPEKVCELLLAEIRRMRKQGVDEQIFNLCKNMLYGELITNLENADDFAQSMAQAHLKNYTLKSEIETLANVKIEDINALLQQVLSEDRMVKAIINPLEEAKNND